MFLPASLSVFIRTTQALVLGLEQDAISTVSASQAAADTSARFGLGGVLNPDTEEVTVSVAQLLTGIDFSRVIRARVGVYRVLDADSDYLLVESEVDAALLKRQPQNKQLQMLDIRFRVQVPEEEIAIACSVDVTETDNAGADVVNTYSATAVVVTASASQPMFRYVERFRPSVNASDTHEERIEIPDDMLVEDGDAESTLFDFDFTQPDDNILRAGSADIAYAGGGSRWLQDQDDGSGVANFTLQTRHQKPWEIPAQLMLEGGSTNHFPHPELQAQDAVRYSSRDSLSVVESQFNVDSFSGYQAIAYACAGSMSINNEFRLDFKAVPFDLFLGTDYVTGSVLMETTTTNAGTSANRNRLGYALVLRYLDGSGNIVHETKKQLPDQGVPVFDIVSVQDTPAVVADLRAAHPEIVSVGLRVLVTGACPGDRFTVTVAAPQLETGAVAGSRIRGSTSSRNPDTLRIGAQEENITAYDNAYGMFRFTGVPMQDRVLVPQTLFDTRVVTNPTGIPNAYVYGSGYWCRQIPNTQDNVVVGSVFEFGCLDADDTEFVVTTTVPVLLSTTSPTTIKCLFAGTGIGIVVSDPTQTVIAKAYTDAPVATPLVAPDMGIGIRVGARSDDLEPWFGALLGFALEARSLDIETARTDSGIVSDWQ